MKSRKFSQRLFLAIELPRFAREVILEKRKKWRKQLESDMRWVPPLNLRLSMRFLGEIEVKKSKQLSAKLVSLCKELAPFQLSVDKIGASPTRAEATNLWLGFEEPTELLTLLREVEVCCDELTLPRDKKPFQARISLTKTSEAQRVPELKIKPDFKGFKVRTLCLMESRMGQNGPTYHPLRKFELSGPKS